MVPFNKIHVPENFMDRIGELVTMDPYEIISQVEDRVAEEFGYDHFLLYSTCTHAIESAAMAMELGPGDEVIVPSFAFSSCANAFLLRGANVVFADSLEDSPNVSLSAIEASIGPNTKAVLVIHYAGAHPQIKEIASLCRERGIVLIEDCAHVFGHTHEGRLLGTYGDFGAFSFHHTKMISAYEGGGLLANNQQFLNALYETRENGTNKRQFKIGEVPSYAWQRVGSSHLIALPGAFLIQAHLSEGLRPIFEHRKSLVEAYNNQLQPLRELGYTLPNADLLNGSMHYILCPSSVDRDKLLSRLKSKDIVCTRHYQALHTAAIPGTSFVQEPVNALAIEQRIIRLPLYTSLTESELTYIAETVCSSHE